MRRITPIVLALFLALPLVAHAGVCDDITFPQTTSFDGATLQLNGRGVRQVTFLNINVYIAALYLEHTSHSGGEIASSLQHKRLVQHFVHSASHSQIADAMTESFHNSPGGTAAALQPRLTQLIALLTPCSDGTVVTYSYTPGTGLFVSYGSNRLGMIPGDDFAAAFFGIFVGPHPPNTGLRTGLLGGSCS